MYIESVRNRNSPPAILLRESFRQDGKVHKRTLCNLSDWPSGADRGAAWGVVALTPQVSNDIK
jgi:hypothetical protein